MGVEVEIQRDKLTSGEVCFMPCKCMLGFSCVFSCILTKCWLLYSKYITQ